MLKWRTGVEAYVQNRANGGRPMWSLHGEVIKNYIKLKTYIFSTVVLLFFSKFFGNISEFSDYLQTS